MGRIHLLSGVLVVAALAVTGCGRKYSDVKSVTEKQIKVFETYVNELDRAGNAREAAAAMNTFADNMEKLIPQTKKLAEKYPELQDRDAVPKELQELNERMEEVSSKLGASMMKIMPYMEDKDVVEAQKRFMQILMAAQ